MNQSQERNEVKMVLPQSQRNRHFPSQVCLKLCLVHKKLPYFAVREKIRFNRGITKLIPAHQKEHGLNNIQNTAKVLTH